MTKLELHWQILIAILLAGLAGYFVNSSIASGVEDPSLFGISAIGFFDYIGSLFLNALKMIIVPLIFSSIVMGVAGIGSGQYADADAVLCAYATRYFGNEPEAWAMWLTQWETPWAVDVAVARAEFDRLATDAADSWRLQQWEYKLRLFEAHHAVESIPTWTPERLAAADRFWETKEYLRRHVWKLGLTRAIFKFDWRAPDWHAEYREQKNLAKHRPPVDASPEQ